MAKRNAHDVLGVELDAGDAAIKAAWRRLARRHHPDVTGTDPAAARLATRKMVEINAAYEELRDPARRRASAARAAVARNGQGWEDAADAASGTGRPSGTGNGDEATAAGRQGRTGPPRPRPGRPVTARLDTSETFAPRNQTLTRGGRAHVRGHAPVHVDRGVREPLRASDPTGPLRRDRVRGFSRPAPPVLAEARARTMEFGKFRGHTLGDIAAFEPSYIDWISKTITRDPELVAAARVVQADLDARGVVRINRAPRPGSPRV